MKNRFLISLVFLFFILHSLGTVSAAPGKGSGSHLRVDVGGRPVAMGGVQFASEKSLFSQFYNPGLLGWVGQKEVGLMHNEYLLNVRQEVVGYAHPLENDWGVLGGAINYFGYGDITGYDSLGKKTGDLSASDMVLSGSWGKRLDFTVQEVKIEDLGVGASLKILRRSLAGVSGIGFAVDAGFIYPIRWGYLDRMKVAGAILNVSNGLKLEGSTDDLGSVLRLGVAQSYWGEAMTVGVDGVVGGGSSFHPAVGLEYKILKMVSLRAGYKGSKDLVKNFTYGIGFENPLFSVDYAFVPFGDLEDTHRVSLVYRFGKSREKPRADAQLREKLKDAKTLYAQGLLVDAYLIAMQVNHVAPWLDENRKLLQTIQKGFKELEESDKKEKVLTQINGLFDRGENFFNEGNLINARLDFQAVLGLQPDHAAALGYLKQIEGQFQSFVENFYRDGLVAFAAEDYEKAKDSFEKVIVIKPDHDEAKAQLAKCVEILEHKKKEAETQAMQEEAGKVQIEALAAYKAERYEEAVNLFEQVIGIDPKNAEAQRYIASAHEILYKQFLSKGQDFTSRGDWDAGIRNFKMALLHNPRGGEARSALINVQRRSELQRKVLSQNLYKEGLEAFLGGNKKKAQTAWKKSLELDPENEEAKRGMARIGQ
ncbi:MAG: PorV/PorQ family protein [Elusimicrobia bacterium]|nr:PorV/PorQ family protein [Elusimicrobiota bacterium]